MQLIGYLDSPFVRRVAVSARFLGVDYTHRELSIFSQYDEFRQINPLVKIPTLISDDGRILVESTLIIDYLESLAGRRLAPDHAEGKVTSLQFTGAALVAMEKVAQLIYETKQRPKELQHALWIERLSQQLRAAVDLMETNVGDGDSWLVGSTICQADISTAIAWRFVQNVTPEKVPATNYPGLGRFSDRAERLPEFIACPLP